MNTVFNQLENKKFVIATGPSGCGKSYSFHWFQSNTQKYGFEKTIMLDSNYFGEDEDYNPFKKALFSQEKAVVKHVKQGVVAIAKDAPIGSNLADYIVNTLLMHSTNKNTGILNEEERVLVNQLKKMIRNKEICIICDNIHWWDRRSLGLLVSLLTSKDLLPFRQFGKVKFILSITDNQDSPNGDIIKESLLNLSSYTYVTFPGFSYVDFKKYLYQETVHSLSEAQIELLFNLVNGHLKVFFEVINEIDRNSFDFNVTYESNKAYLNDILNKRLKECGATGVQIIKVLEYASIIGITFSGFELQHLTEYTKARIKKIIEDASALKLTEGGEDKGDYKFAHDIVREIFKSRVDENHVDYYSTMSLCLKEIKPSQYMRRAKYMHLSLNTEKAAVLYCLEIISQLRTYGNINDSIFREADTVINKTQKEYIKYMEQAYDAYHLKKYDISLKYLNLILSYYPTELLAERDILKLRCYSKKLATAMVADEIQYLDNKRMNKSFNGEKEVLERYMHTLITAYAHLGEIKRAKELEENVLVQLAERIDFDDDCQIRVHVIKRNANAIHGIDTAPIFMKEAVDYFGQVDVNGGCRNIRQFYTSMINYSAILIKQGNFSDAYKQTIEAFKLEEDNPDIIFSRTQILRSNNIVASVLDGRINLQEAAALYKELINNLPGVLAEKLFYASNLSIIYSLNNQPDKAFEILCEEALKHDFESDREGLYRYRVNTNMAIYRYLMEDEGEAVARLEAQRQSLKSLINGSYFEKKNDIIINIMNQKKKINGANWLYSVQNECPEFQGKPWRYFGLGYAFAALCDWGI